MTQQQPRRESSRWLREVAGWGLLAAGIAGCILPILPGVPLILAGLLILSRDYVWAQRAVGRVKRWAVRLRRKARSRRSNNAVSERRVAGRDKAEEV